MPSYERIPAELREEPCWVNVWNSSKVPMMTTAVQAASSSNPLSWGTFDKAAENVCKGLYDGIGYVFHRSGLVGVDIDVGREDDGMITPVAFDIIHRCKSYTEISRSGRGFHILVRGRLPFDGKNNLRGVEIYQSGRYFIMTGRQVVYSEIVEGQEAIDYILQQYFSEPESADTVKTSRIYSPVYRKPSGGKIYLQPTYPEIPNGCRNISLTSLGGQLHTLGYSRDVVWRELVRANTQACKPPLDEREVRQILNSVTRYRR